MGMRLLFPASCSVWPQSIRLSRRVQRRAIAIDQAAGSVIESLETRVLFAATITGAPHPPLPRR